MGGSDTGMIDRCPENNCTANILKIETHLINTLIVPKMVICSKAADGMANSETYDQTAPEEQSGLGLHCLLRPFCPNT